jgi:hypothetical protein
LACLVTRLQIVVPGTKNNPLLWTQDRPIHGKSIGSWT